MTHQIALASTNTSQQVRLKLFFILDCIESNVIEKTAVKELSEEIFNLISNKRRSRYSYLLLKLEELFAILSLNVKDSRIKLGTFCYIYLLKYCGKDTPRETLYRNKIKIAISEDFSCLTTKTKAEYATKNLFRLINLLENANQAPDLVKAITDLTSMHSSRKVVNCITYSIEHTISLIDLLYRNLVASQVKAPVEEKHASGTRAITVVKVTKEKAEAKSTLINLTKKTASVKPSTSISDKLISYSGGRKNGMYMPSRMASITLSEKKLPNGVTVKIRY